MSLLPLIDGEVRNRIETLKQQFQSNRPFRHVVVDRFLEPSFCDRLLAEFPGFDATKARNELGEVGRKAVVPDIATIGAAYTEFDRLMRSRDFLTLLGELTGIPKLVYDPEYIGGGTHENLHGQDLDPHIDFNYHPHRPLHRRLNLIVFLNPEWKESWGGCLELYRDAWDRDNGEARTIVPIANRAVVFETTENSWHGFRRIELPEDRQHVSRRSVAVYFYTVERPAEQTAPSHGTVYVPRELPEHLRPGYTLNDADTEHMQILIARRDAQIRFLYEREMEYSAAMSRLMRSPSYRIGRALTWPIRQLRKGR
ncbi:MAG: 2OG-Fe(II) oxygenase [Acidobacteriota bacterium]|nr:2OG-Fe(II) oxygenase [Acidobacteriota bacterium]